MTPDAPLDPCPFCGADDPAPMEVDRNSWAVVCGGCGAIGPLGLGRQQGIILWNVRRMADAPPSSPPLPVPGKFPISD